LVFESVWEKTLLLQGGSTEIWIKTRQEAEAVSVASAFELLPVVDAVAAAALLRRLCPHPGDVAQLRQLAASRRAGPPLTRCDDPELVEILASALADGRLVLVRRHRRMRTWPSSEVEVASPREVEEAEAPPAALAAPAPAKTWIEIQLIGEDDRPLPGERYRIELPDGALREGKLDSQGVARVSDIESGDCRITFPDLDEDAWEAV